MISFLFVLLGEVSASVMVRKRINKGVNNEINIKWKRAVLIYAL